MVDTARVVRTFDLDGLIVKTALTGQELRRVVERLLGPYRVIGRAPAHADISVDIRRRRRPSAPWPEGKPRFQFPPLLAFETSSGWRLVDDVGEILVDPGKGAIAGSVSSGAARSSLVGFGGLTLWVALVECLRARGRYPLHAAAILSPRGHVHLLPGGRRAGKSTIALAMIELGWTIVSDDTVFLCRGRGGALEIIGYERPFHLRRDFLERRPDLLPLVRSPDPGERQDKVWVSPGGRFAARLQRRAGRPSRIAFPAVIDAPASRLVEMRPKESLLAMLHHSSFVFIRPELAPDHLAILRDLVDGAGCARLLCGRDVLDDPSRYARLLESEPCRRAA